MRKIVVIGMGYVGIPAAVLLASAGYDVTGIQRKSQRSGWKINWLNAGKCPIGGNEPELPEMLEKVVKAGKFRVADNYMSLKKADIILIDVQTPTDEQHIPRYESLKEVSRQIGKLLRPGQLVIIESTVAPGTTECLVKPILEQESGLQAGLPGGFGLCFSYERVMVGRLRRTFKLEKDGQGRQGNYSYDIWQNQMRYETAIERQIYKALHELERLQKARLEKLPDLSAELAFYKLLPDEYLSKSKRK